ncbi:MAG TPA: type II secretion system minor pseudopilin GspJ [Candidatus Competibacteraceae bacterium]|nr:type II secretion system minor pseudopilin GspJ [Candidatus Competibacteraceae bacterium]
MNTCRPAPAAAGFTLLELLVALAVFAVVAVAAYGGLDSVLVSRAAAEAESARLARVQMALYWLEQDLAQAVPRPIRDDYGQPQPALASDPLQPEFLLLTRTGWSNPLGRPRADLQRVGYRLQEGRLYRRYWLTLDRGVYAEPRETLLLENVREVRLRFLDQEGRWQERWPPAGGHDDDTLPLLPPALELTLILADWGEIPRLLITGAR